VIAAGSLPLDPSAPYNSHRSAAPDKAASFKSLYLNRPHSMLPGNQPSQWALQIQPYDL
jgi:hypothetical protein